MTLKPPIRVKWKKHRTVTGILSAFFGGRAGEFVAMDDSGNEFDIRKQIDAEGMWAFVETKRNPPLIHWWQDGKRTKAELAHMLGHELGHITGKRMTGWREELRADDYGRVAEMVMAKLSA